MAVSDVDVSSSIDQNEDRIEELTDEELYNLVEETLQANSVLKNETNMFEKYLKRVDTKDSTGTGTMLVQAVQEQTTSRTLRKRTRSRGQSVDRNLKLSAEQKCDIAQRELEELKEEIEKLKDESERILDNYKAIMEEADIQIAETKKASYEFNRDIIQGSVNARTSKIIAEKVVRYFEDKIRSRDTLIEKLRLKNSTFRVQKKKLQMQLKQKEEMGEVLHEVDFNQLKIENQQYLEKIDDRNKDLLRLKLMTGNVLQVLNTYKKKLHTLTVESAQLKQEISSRTELSLRIDAETRLVEKERVKALELNQKRRQQLSDYRVPEVLDYVKERASHYELNKTVRMWERKVEIAEMALNTYRKTWKQIQTHNSMESWYSNERQEAQKI
ncbi:coiled-coil domain-containing protein 113-like [Dendronephthya gigantea]|uniref:coiled-coil domain-containing protein 113-like n=1 Tax=Dendronephthya gigantea TaxID=151771 RepID=UPI00106B4485|nr:coiled-coil domain-containing protein 113-like [Dendronephthya gigantea]